MSTTDLVDAIIDNNAANIQTELNSVLMQKVADKLETMRTDLAQNLFQSENTVTENVIETHGKARIHEVNGQYVVKHPFLPDFTTPSINVARDVAQNSGKVGKPVSEDIIDESLSNNSPPTEWIKDFLESDAPQFKGKTPEQRKQMALAAYYSKKK